MLRKAEASKVLGSMRMRIAGWVRESNPAILAGSVPGLDMLGTL